MSSSSYVPTGPVFNMSTFLESKPENVKRVLANSKAAEASYSEYIRQSEIADKARKEMRELERLREEILRRKEYVEQGGRLGHETAAKIRTEALGPVPEQLEFYRLKEGGINGSLNILPRLTQKEIAAREQASINYRKEIEAGWATYRAAKKAAEAEVKAAETAEKARAKAAANAARAMAGPLTPMNIESKKKEGGTRKRHRRMTRKKSRKAKKTI